MRLRRPWSASTARDAPRAHPPKPPYTQRNPGADPPRRRAQGRLHRGEGNRSAHAHLDRDWQRTPTRARRRQDPRSRRVRLAPPAASRFDRQSAEYRESVLPASCRQRVAVEAGVTVYGISMSGSTVKSSALIASASVRRHRLFTRNSASPPRPWSPPLRHSERVELLFSQEVCPAGQTFLTEFRSTSAAGQRNS